MEFDNAFFEDVWLTLEGVFRVHLSAETRAIWQRTLDHLPRRAIFDGISGISKEQDKMPSLAQILRYARAKLPPVHSPRHTAGKDSDGVPCWYFEDRPTDATYLAMDCPEGREFLALLKKVALKKDLNEAG